MNDGPFTDDMIRGWLKVAQTQRGIIDYAEGMAQVLAEAGRASNKAVGDSPETAVRRWSEIILRRALDILKEEQNGKDSRDDNPSSSALHGNSDLPPARTAPVSQSRHMGAIRNPARD